MTLKKLPIGIQTFARLRQQNDYDVDKTKFALRLIDENSHDARSSERRIPSSERIRAQRGTPLWLPRASAPCAFVESSPAMKLSRRMHAPKERN